MKLIKRQLISDIKKHGNVSRACKKRGVARSTIYYWVAMDSEFKQEYTAATEAGRS